MPKTALLACAAIIAFAACAHADGLTDRVDALEKRVNALEQKTATSPASSASTVSSAPSSAVILVRWDYATKKDAIFDSYFISYTIRNGYDKSLKLVVGSISFKDILGDVIYGIQLDKDVVIPAGKEASFSGSYPRIGPASERMAAMTKADITADLIIKTVVFADNTIVKIER